MSGAPLKFSRIFHPKTLLVGVVLGLVSLSWIARYTADHNYHPGSVRFHPMIAPDSLYQPTIAEMQAFVRVRCRSDQVLVIVGGNSIFLGVGQPVEKLWTKYLQKILGDQYAVVNLAFRGSSPTDAGAIVAETLRTEYPRQIYLANATPFSLASPIGDTPYRFMMLDAFYKGWLINFPARNVAMNEYLTHSKIHPEAAELKLSAILDRALRFREFWNWWSATQFFTFPAPLAESFDRAYQPRDYFGDQEPDFETMPFSDRFSPRFAEAEMSITRNSTSGYYHKNTSGVWQLNEGATTSFRNQTRQAFPDEVKPRTLIILSRNSPYYTARLTDSERGRDEMGFKDTLALLKMECYEAMEYGSDFTEVDFGDRTHLTATGGRKLADRVAPQIRQIAIKLGYLNP